MSGFVEVIHGSLTDRSLRFRALAEELALVVDGLLYQTRSELYATARDENLMVIANLVLEEPASSTEAPKTEYQVEPRGPRLPLGARKSLARTPQRQLLNHICRDPHPAVVEIALDNPYITEDDVVNIAARRPSAASSLAQIARHPHWRRQPRIRRALVRNPFCPPTLAYRLTIALRPGDLIRIAADPQLDQRVRDHARGLLAFIAHDR